MRKKFLDYMRRFRIKDDLKRQAVEAGVLDKKDYIAWRQAQIYNGKRYAKMVETLAGDMHSANMLAKSTILEHMPEAYTYVKNHEMYAIDQLVNLNTSFTLYNAEATEKLIRENPELLPPPKPGGETARKLAENKDLRWNRQKISSALMQGIIQGESVPKIARRLESVGEMNHRAAIRNARTMHTSVQNAAKIDSGYWAKSKGVDISYVWSAALDMRTRPAHRQLDGQRRNLGEPFEVDGEEIMYPGDPSAPGYLVYNCRCVLVRQVKGYEYDIRDDYTDYEHINGMTYEQWKKSDKVITNPITLPEEKAKAIKGAYIGEYIKLRRSLGG